MCDVSSGCWIPNAKILLEVIGITFPLTSMDNTQSTAFNSDTQGLYVTFIRFEHEKHMVQFWKLTMCCPLKHKVPFGNGHEHTGV